MSGTGEPASTPIAASLAVRVHGLSAGYDTNEVLHHVDLDVEPGETLALLGPSGCGKTTLLRCIAGLEVARAGAIVIGDTDVTAGRGVPPERRRVGMVFQDGALFPHRDVIGNVGYGLPRGPLRTARSRAALELVGLADKAERMPSTLSGGEQQRVALARALAPQPGVLLLDEPFSSLDAALRVQLRHEVRRLLADIGVTALLVTHDQEEALMFGDRVAVMRAGRIEQHGTAEEVYSAPASEWVAQFVGEANLLPATIGGGRAETPIGMVPARPGPAVTSPVPGTVMFRPEQLAVDAGGLDRVIAVTYFGRDTRYEVAAGERTIACRVPGAPQHRVGDAVTARFTGAFAHTWSEPVATTP